MEAVWKSIVAWTKISGRRRVVLCPVPIWVVRGAQRNKCYGNQWDSNCQLSNQTRQPKISDFNLQLFHKPCNIDLLSGDIIYYVYIRKIINIKTQQAFRKVFFDVKTNKNHQEICKKQNENSERWSSTKHWSFDLLLWITGVLVYM